MYSTCKLLVRNLITSTKIIPFCSLRIWACGNLVSYYWSWKKNDQKIDDSVNRLLEVIFVHWMCTSNWFVGQPQGLIHREEGEQLRSEYELKPTKMSAWSESETNTNRIWKFNPLSDTEFNCEHFLFSQNLSRITLTEDVLDSLHQSVLSHMYNYTLEVVLAQFLWEQKILQTKFAIWIVDTFVSHFPDISSGEVRRGRGGGGQPINTLYLNFRPSRNHLERFQTRFWKKVVHL